MASASELLDKPTLQQVRPPVASLYIAQVLSSAPRRFQADTWSCVYKQVLLLLQPLPPLDPQHRV